MKILLDHCIPKRFRNLLPGHQVFHTSQLGWGGLSNGKLLTSAEAAGFEIMVTVDRSLPSQQNLNGRNISVICLICPQNNAPALAPLAGLILLRLGEIGKGEFISITHPDLES